MRVCGSRWSLTICRGIPWKGDEDGNHYPKAGSMEMYRASGIGNGQENRYGFMRRKC